MGARILLGYAKEEPDDDDSEFQGFSELVCHVVTKYHVLIPFRAFPHVTLSHDASLQLHGGHWFS